MTDSPQAAFLEAACVPLEGGHASGTLERAEAILAAHPEIASGDIHAAAILGDEASVRRFLEHDPANATARGGPRGWDALTHLCFSRYLRLDRARSEGFVGAARILLDVGADANTGWYETSHQPQPEWESALYGAAGVAHHAELTSLLLERGADPNMQLFFKPANVSGTTNTRGSTPLIRAANNGDLEVVKILLEHGADATLYMADRQTPIHAVLAGRTLEPQALELIRVLHNAGTDVNVVALVNHEEEVRGGSALHFAVRKRYKEVIKELASYGVDMNAKDQDGLTALDYTQSRGFMPFMALQTPLYKEEATLLRELGATTLMAKSPVWPVLGPPQGVWADIPPLGEPTVHEPVYKPTID